MRCGKCQDQLYEYFDGTLTPSARESVREHLAQCPDCRAVFEQERQFSKSMTGLFEQQTRDLSLAPQVCRNVLIRVRQWKAPIHPEGVLKGISWRPILTAAACFVMICMSAFMLKYRQFSGKSGQMACFERHQTTEALLQMHVGQISGYSTLSRREDFSSLRCFQTSKQQRFR